jgi:hypothetical protein
MDRQQTETGDILTVEQMTALLRDDLARVDAAGAAHDTHMREWEHTETRIDIGGEYGEGREEIRAGMLASQRPELEAAARAAEGAGAAAIQNARRILAQIGEDRITLPLTEITTASTLAPLIEKDAERLSLPRLATEVRAAVATGQTAAMYCWSRAIAPRLAHRPTGEEHPDDARARSELARLQSQIRTALRDTTFDPLRKDVDRVLERAGTVRAKAGKTRQRLAGPVKTTAGETKVPWPAA